MFLTNCMVNKVGLSTTKEGSIIAELKVMTQIEPEEIGRLEEVLAGSVDLSITKIQMEMFRGNGDSVQGGNEEIGD